MHKTTVILALGVIMAAGAARADRDFTFHKNDHFDGKTVSIVKIDMRQGEIGIFKASGADVEINFKNTIRASDQKEADKLNSEYGCSARLDGSTLAITVEMPQLRGHGKSIISRIINGDWDDDYSPMLRVSVPDGMSIEVNSSSADMEISDVSADITIESASSDIDLENTSGKVDCRVSSGDMISAGHQGPLSLKGNSSDLRMTDVQGDLNAYTSSGDISIDKVKGSVDAASVSGDCRIYDVDGDLAVKSTSGDIGVNSVSGSVKARAVSGDVHLGALSAAAGDFDVESVSGDITMEVSDKFEGEVSVRSISGDVSSHLSADLDTYSNSRLRGSVGEGHGRLDVSSTSGDISIDRY
jgi:DUF4097 and DUF4098 domain-containing protein YvlB